MVQVWHYDGTSAIRHECALVPDGDGFRLRLESGDGERHLWSDLTFINGTAYGHKLRQGWRVGFVGAAPADIYPLLPKPTKYGALVDRIGLGPAAIAFIAASAAMVAVVVKTPEWLAPLVPLSFEQKLGDAMFGDFGGRVCNGPGGQVALDAMVRRIEPNAQGLKVRVVNINMVNAVALPGGNILVFRGLLQEAQSPDELAGVLGHEIGHVRNRDVMQALLRQMGLSVLLGGANSDVSGGINTLISSSYSRDAESKADQYSIRAMQRAAVSPADTAGFFERLAATDEKVERKAKEKGKAASANSGRSVFDYLASHPMSAAREKAFRSSAIKGAKHTPSISPEQWRALIDSCANDPDVEDGDSLFF